MTEQHRRVPLRLVAPRPGDTPNEIANKVADALFAIAPRVEALDESMERVEIAVLAMPTTMRGIVREELHRAPPMRDAEKSWHEYDPAVASLRQSLRARVDDKGDPLDERKAAALIESVNEAVRMRRDAAVWQSIRGFPAKVASKAAENIATHLLTLLIGALAVLLWHLFVARGAPAAPVVTVPIPVPTPTLPAAPVHP